MQRTNMYTSTTLAMRQRELFLWTEEIKKEEKK